MVGGAGGGMLGEGCTTVGGGTTAGIRADGVDGEYSECERWRPADGAEEEVEALLAVAVYAGGAVIDEADEMVEDADEDGG